MAERMWRAVAVFRVVTLVYAATLIVRDHRAYAHPAFGLVALAVMVGWSVAATVGYARPATRTRGLVVADVAVAAALIVATRWVDTVPRIEHGAATLPVAWAATPVLACAVIGGPWAGLAGGAVISVADAVERQALPHTTFNGIVLLLIVGSVGGYVVRLGRRAEAAVATAARLEATEAERRRIAREVHDSVLQVLALVSARGRELGGEAAELGALAAQQEATLRRLVTAPPTLSDEGLLDLCTLLEPYADEGVTLSCPAEAVPLPEGAASAVAAAVSEALGNVRGHAGEGARAWVLVEDDDDTVVVTVRDDGIGFEPHHTERAAARGRLGVAQSITGRLRDAGGTARVTSTPGEGTEVELRVSRRR